MFSDFIDNYKHVEFEFESGNYGYENELEVFSHFLNLHALDLEEKVSGQLHLFKTVMQLLRAFEQSCIIFD